MTSNRRARVRPVWVPAMPLAILLMAAALAACRGESSGSDAPLSLETESRNDDSIGAGDGDAIANDVQNDGHDAAGLFVSASAGLSHTCGARGAERRLCRLPGQRCGWQSHAARRLPKEFRGVSLMREFFGLGEGAAVFLMRGHPDLPPFRRWGCLASFGTGKSAPSMLRKNENS